MAEKSSDKLVVVLAVDQSEFSEYSFKWYVKNLHNPEHQVHMVHVQGDKKIKSPEKRRESWDHGKKVGDNYLGWAEKNGIKDAKFETPKGEHEWQEILNYSEKVGAHMIVIGCRGLGIVNKTLTGSVSDNVLKNSPIPVLVCRAKTD